MLYLPPTVQKYVFTNRSLCVFFSVCPPLSANFVFKAIFGLIYQSEERDTVMNPKNLSFIYFSVWKDLVVLFDGKK